MEKEIKVKNFPNLRTVYLSGEINGDTLQQFKKDLDILIQADEDVCEENVRNLKSVSQILSDTYAKTMEYPPIVLDMTSPGGYIYTGLALYDIIRNYNLNSKHKIIARVSGLIASAATIVILACDERECGKNTTFMIHSVASWCSGKVQDMEDDLEETKRLADIMKGIYTERTNITLKQLKEVDKLKKDWVLTADEAKDLGLITNIL